MKKQCEGHCIQGRKGSAVQISSIEHYISNGFFEKLQLEKKPPKGQRVAVIGAGNSAMDAARTALRQGSRFVTIYARSNHVTASQRELDYAIADGAEILYGMAVEKITEQGPVFVKREFSEAGEMVSQGLAELAPADSTIIAVSQRPKDKLVNTTSGLDVNDKGLVAVDEHGQTTRPGIFSAGDVVTGPWNVVEAAKAAKKVAEQMDAYLQSL